MTLFKYVKLNEHWGIEINLICPHKWDTIPIINFDLSYTPKTSDHQGLKFLFAIWRLQFEINVYDNRHVGDNNDFEGSEENGN